MRAVIQRVKKASVVIDNKIYSSIGPGLLVFLGIGENDKDSDLDFIVDKSLNIRIFEDENGKMNLSLSQISGEILVVSQFTLYGDMKKGKRPNFSAAAHPELGEMYYNKYIEKVSHLYEKVKTGVFGADMQVEIVNDGPVTIIIDSER